MANCIKTTWVILLFMLMGNAVHAQHKDLPSDFQQLLPRGRISAVTQPEFVSADKAEIADDTWVLGVVMNGQAKAYSLNLLNSHEIVNDMFGKKPVAAVW